MKSIYQLVPAALLAGAAAGCASQAPVDDSWYVGNDENFGQVTEIERVVAPPIVEFGKPDARTVWMPDAKTDHGEARERFRIAVRMQGGAYRVYEQHELDRLAVGDDVRIFNGRVSRR